MSTSFTDRSFHRYSVQELSSFAPLVHGRDAGIYIFEFANGQRYVGQTTNFVNRFSQHIHGSDHHEPWEDINVLWVMDADPHELRELELQVIAWQKEEGHSLRNKVFNLGFEGHSELDTSVSVIDQLHWALGDSDFNTQSLRQAAQRTPGPETKLHASKVGQQRWMDGIYANPEDYTVADAACFDLGTVIAHAIPDAAELEKIYWTVSDYPNTAGGRLATLNVGSLEVVFIPRSPQELIHPNNDTKWLVHYSHLNLSAGTLMDTDSQQIKERWQHKRIDMFPIDIYQNQYPIGTVDCIDLPTGLLTDLFQDPEILQGTRELCLDLMRSNQAGMFRRWHSAELTRQAYKTFLEKTEEHP